MDDTDGIALSFSQFFNQVLMLGKTSVSDLSEHVFDLILELYNIDSHLLLSVLPQLEFKLKVSGHYCLNLFDHLFSPSFPP